MILKLYVGKVLISLIIEQEVLYFSNNVDNISSELDLIAMFSFKIPKNIYCAFSYGNFKESSLNHMCL